MTFIRHGAAADMTGPVIDLDEGHSHSHPDRQNAARRYKGRVLCLTGECCLAIAWFCVYLGFGIWFPSVFLEFLGISKMGRLYGAIVGLLLPVVGHAIFLCYRYESGRRLRAGDEEKNLWRLVDEQIDRTVADYRSGGEVQIPSHLDSREAIEWLLRNLGMEVAVKVDNLLKTGSVKKVLTNNIQKVLSLLEVKMKEDFERLSRRQKKKPKKK